MAFSDGEKWNPPELEIFTPQTEQAVREILSTIPDLKDRVFLLILMRNVPMQMQRFAAKLMDQVEKAVEELPRE